MVDVEVEVEDDEDDEDEAAGEAGGVTKKRMWVLTGADMVLEVFEKAESIVQRSVYICLVKDAEVSRISSAGLPRLPGYRHPRHP